MGKGNRARRTALIIGAVALLAVIGLCVGLIADAVEKNGGYSLRGKKALYSEHFSVTGTMMSYFISNYAAAFMDTYADNLSAMGLDTLLPLKSQPYDE